MFFLQDHMGPRESLNAFLEWHFIKYKCEWTITIFWKEQRRHHVPPACTNTQTKLKLTTQLFRSLENFTKNVQCRDFKSLTMLLSHLNNIYSVQALYFWEMSAHNAKFMRAMVHVVDVAEKMETWLLGNIAMLPLYTCRSITVGVSVNRNGCKARGGRQGVFTGGGKPRMNAQCSSCPSLNSTYLST